MTPEEYQRIKDAEKEHLRKLKELKKAVHLLHRRKSVNQALENMATGMRGSLDEHEEMIDQLARETAQHEARLELALEQTDLDDTADEATSAAPEALDEEMVEVRAKTLLRQIKLQMGAPDAEDPAPTPARQHTPSAPQEKTPPDPAEPNADLPEKTIGRMRP